MNSVASAGSYTLERMGAQSVRWCAVIDTILERRFWPIVITLTAILAAVLLTTDFQLKLWNDELISLNVARSSGFRQIATMTLAGADATPPLYSVIVHCLLPYSPSEALATRLPSTIGFCAMIVAVSGYAHRRLPAAYAIIAGLTAAAATIDYGSEGRSYGLILGFAAVSLLLWSLAAEGRSRSLTLPLLAVCIAAMAALHYYTVLFPVCLLLAQLIHERAERRFRLSPRDRLAGARRHRRRGPLSVHRRDSALYGPQLVERVHLIHRLQLQIVPQMARRSVRGGDVYRDFHF